MSLIKIISIVIAFFSMAVLVACTENPKENDPASTITPGNNIKVDNATAHANNVDSVTLVKRNKGDTIPPPYGNDKNSGTKNNGIVKSATGSNVNDNTNNPH